MPDEFVPELKPLSETRDTVARPGLPVPGFWSRALCLTLDVALLTFLCYLVAKYFYPVFYSLGNSLQIVVCVLVYLYFFVSASPLTQGKSLARHILKFRLVRMDGQPLDWGWAAVRALFSSLMVYAWLLLLARQVLSFHMLVLPIEYSARVFLLVMGYLGGAYAAANAIYCAGHPKKRSFHDLLLGSAVIKAEEKESGAIAFLNAWSEVDRIKAKNALFPALFLGAIVLFMFGQIYWRTQSWAGSVPVERNSILAMGDLSKSINSRDFSAFYLIGPSPEFSKIYDERLKAEQESRRIANKVLLTTESLRLIPDGRKFLVVFHSRELLTSETLSLNPEYARIKEELPAVLSDLSTKYFKSEDGEPYPWNGVMLEFRQTLPLYLYFSSRRIWIEMISVGPPYAVPERAPRDAGTTETLSSNPAE
jgi:uncharacterized RDD family membrane protein YckC